MQKPGTLYGIGVGPGDPDLLTIKGKKTLKKVDIIFAPKKSKTDQSYALSIIKKHIKSDKNIKTLIFPMTKDKKILNDHWVKASTTINEALEKGADCAIITEGDPFLFSTFIYIFKKIKELNPNAKIKVIPGISSINASACNSLVPLAEANETVAIIPANYNSDKINDILNIFDTLVLLKVKNVLSKVIKTIKESRFKLQVILVQKCGSNDELILKGLDEIEKTKLDYFSLLILKKVK